MGYGYCVIKAYVEEAYKLLDPAKKLFKHLGYKNTSMTSCERIVDQNGSVSGFKKIKPITFTGAEITTIM